MGQNILGWSSAVVKNWKYLVKIKFVGIKLNT